MKQKLSDEEKLQEKKDKKWFNEFVRRMKHKGALVSTEIINTTTNKQQQLFT